MSLSFRSNFWKTPLGFAPSFLIQSGFFLSLFFLEKNLRVPSWPFNLFLALIVIAMIMIIHFVPRSVSTAVAFFREWIVSMPGTLSALAFFTLHMILLGLDKSGEMKILHSWSLALVVWQLLLSLALALLKRIQDRTASATFILNHLGLLLLLLIFMMSAGDRRNFRMVLHEGSVTWEGEDQQTQQAIELPFAIKLNDFHLEEFPGRPAFYNPENETFYSRPPSGYRLQILKTLLSAGRVEEEEGDEFRYERVRDLGSVNAFLVQVYQEKQLLRQGWVASRSLRFDGDHLLITPQVAVVVIPPRPSLFESLITFYTPDGKRQDKISIRVNHPFHYQNYAFYQSGYDEMLGKLSTKSILDVVYDPWIPYVWVSFILFAAGTLLFLKRKRLDV